MRPRHVRFTIRGLMIAVLVLAILLSMPIRDLMFLMFNTTILGIMFRCACRLAIMNHGWRGQADAGRCRDLEWIIRDPEWPRGTG
jgi:hypothetical protein